jgi:hypothetical protein
LDCPIASDGGEIAVAREITDFIVLVKNTIKSLNNASYGSPIDNLEIQKEIFPENFS